METRHDRVPSAHLADQDHADVFRVTYIWDRRVAGTADNRRAGISARGSGRRPSHILDGMVVKPGIRGTEKKSPAGGQGRRRAGRPRCRPAHCRSTRGRSVRCRSILGGQPGGVLLDAPPGVMRNAPAHESACSHPYGLIASQWRSLSWAS